MNRSYPLFLIMVVAAMSAAAAHGRPADGTPAAQFWEKALPGTPMPDALAELVQKGIDHSPLAENFTGPYLSIGMCLGHVYVSVCSVERVKKAGTGLFFHEEQVRVGHTMTVSFSPAAVPAILPHDVAMKVPFGNLTGVTTKDVISKFNISPGSKMAAQVGDTLRMCRSPAGGGGGGGGERRACATSLEDMVKAAMRTLGGAAAGGGRVWVAASAVPRGGLPLQPYAVEAVVPLAGDRHVACHDEPYPFAVFRCHRIGLSMTKAYKVSLRGGDGEPAVTMAVICRLDTSDWNPAYPAFEMMHTKPGDGSVCHFMPYANLLFGVKANNAMESF